MWQGTSPGVRKSLSTWPCGVVWWIFRLVPLQMSLHALWLIQQSSLQTSVPSLLLKTYITSQLPYKVNTSILLLHTKFLRAFTQFLSNIHIWTPKHMFLEPWRFSGWDTSLLNINPHQWSCHPARLLPLGYSSLPNGCAGEKGAMSALSGPLFRETECCPFRKETMRYSLSLLLQFFNHCPIKTCSHEMRPINYYII